MNTSKTARFIRAAELHEQKAGYWASKDTGYGDTQARRELGAADYCRKIAGGAGEFEASGMSKARWNGTRISLDDES